MNKNINGKVVTRKIKDMTPEEQRHIEHVYKRAAEKAQRARDERDAKAQSRNMHRIQLGLIVTHLGLVFENNMIPPAMTSPNCKFRGIKLL